MDRPAELLNSTLTPEEVRRWRFNTMIDFRRQPTAPAALIADYEAQLSAAREIAGPLNSIVAAQPSCYVFHSEEEGRKIARQRDEERAAAYRQNYHIAKLRERYSYELAYSIWWQKVADHRAAMQKRTDDYLAACTAHRAEQVAFAEAQADAALAAMPALPERVKTRLRALICWAVNRASRYKQAGEYYMRSRGGPKRRIMRGVPLVEVGELPQPKLPPATYPALHSAF